MTKNEFIRTVEYRCKQESLFCEEYFDKFNESINEFIDGSEFDNLFKVKDESRAVALILEKLYAKIRADRDLSEFDVFMGIRQFADYYKNAPERVKGFLKFKINCLMDNYNDDPLFSQIKNMTKGFTREDIIYLVNHNQGRDRYEYKKLLNNL